MSLSGRKLGVAEFKAMYVQRFAPAPAEQVAPPPAVRLPQRRSNRTHASTRSLIAAGQLPQGMMLGVINLTDE